MLTNYYSPLAGSAAVRPARPAPHWPLFLYRKAYCIPLALPCGGLVTFYNHFTFSLEAASWIDSEAAELRRRVYLPFCGDVAPPPALSGSSATEPRRPAPCSRARAQAHMHMLIASDCMCRVHAGSHSLLHIWTWGCSAWPRTAHEVLDGGDRPDAIDRPLDDAAQTASLPQVGQLEHGALRVELFHGLAHVVTPHGEPLGAVRLSLREPRMAHGIVNADPLRRVLQRHQSQREGMVKGHGRREGRRGSSVQ